jgi:uncharacterized protein YyaL (SSP411 family)
MSNRNPNALIHESSIYLLQHAHNPVNWYPWGETALSLAKKEQKPILVSIGYSACHWCHVMERESFEDEVVAEYMNAHFINIKIDREERPDLDHIYMEAVQIFTKSGGWPLNVFLTPELKPFFGGTYFPPKNIHNRTSWIEVLTNIKSLWGNNRDAIEEQAERLNSHLINGNEFFNRIPLSDVSRNDGFTKKNVESIKNKILSKADTVNGGFGAPPKFPQFFSLEYLFIYGHFYQDQEAIQHALISLKQMLKGGIYDQLAGGISRYSTDEKWLVPHFEKMLYDNALLIGILSDAYQLTKDFFYKEYLEKTLSFCLKEMKSSSGGFFSGMDADSEGVEGKYYTWQKSTVDKILSPYESKIICNYFNILESGNWEHSNILHITTEIDQLALVHNVTTLELLETISAAKQKLHTEREKRIKPIVDEKVILGWNALLLNSMCKAYASLGITTIKEEALELYAFIINKFKAPNGGFYHDFNAGKAKNYAFLDDYAFFIQACLKLQEITGDEHFIEEARKVTEFVINNFSQKDGGLFYYTNVQQKDTPIRKVEIYDAAIPSGNSIMAENLLHLGTLLNQPDWTSRSIGNILIINKIVLNYPSSFGIWSKLILLQEIGLLEITLTGKRNKAALKEILAMFLPNKIIQSSDVEKPYPLLINKNYKEDLSIYICHQNKCLEPVRNIESFKRQIIFK